MAKKLGKSIIKAIFRHIVSKCFRVYNRNGIFERRHSVSNEIKVDAIGKENIAELLKNESQLYLTLLERITELIKNSKK